MNRLPKEQKPVIPVEIDKFIEASKDKILSNDPLSADKTRNISEDSSIQDSENNSNDNNVSNDGNISGNVIIINKPVKIEEVKRVSYYLKPSTIKKIKKLSSKTDMKISPWLQKFLEENLDKIEIK